MTFFALASDYDPLPDLMSSDIDAIGGEVSPLLGSYGYSLERKRAGGRVESTLYCPHAGKIHPQLASGAAFCPMSQLVLGAIRKRHKRSVLQRSRLDKDGSSFVINVQD